MYLCCVETLSEFGSKLDFLGIFKLLKNRAKDPVLYYMVFGQISSKMTTIGENSLFL